MGAGAGAVGKLDCEGVCAGRISQGQACTGQQEQSALIIPHSTIVAVLVGAAWARPSHACAMTSTAARIAWNGRDCTLHYRSGPGRGQAAIFAGAGMPRRTLSERSMSPDLIRGRGRAIRASRKRSFATVSGWREDRKAIQESRMNLSPPNLQKSEPCFYNYTNFDKNQLLLPFPRLLYKHQQLTRRCCFHGSGIAGYGCSRLFLFTTGAAHGPGGPS